jgi:hypothetical protein
LIQNQANDEVKEKEGKVVESTEVTYPLNYRKKKLLNQSIKLRKFMTSMNKFWN